MSNYATLKAAISTAIKQNGNEEITGQVLQTTLLSMVDSLVSGYLFKGIATPSTVVGTPDENVFWIAPAGSYSNFGSTPIDVPTGCIGIFQYDGSFTNTVVYVGGAVDISALSHTAYASLSQALGDLPAALHIGGIEVRYQDSVTSKFVKYRLMATSWSTTESDWQGVEDEPTAGSENLSSGKGVYFAVNKNANSIGILTPIDEKAGRVAHSTKLITEANGTKSKTVFYDVSQYAGESITILSDIYESSFAVGIFLKSLEPWINGSSPDYCASGYEFALYKENIKTIPSDAKYLGLIRYHTYDEVIYQHNNVAMLSDGIFNSLFRGVNDFQRTASIVIPSSGSRFRFDRQTNVFTFPSSTAIKWDNSSVDILGEQKTVTLTHNYGIIVYNTQTKEIVDRYTNALQDNEYVLFGYNKVFVQDLNVLITTLPYGSVNYVDSEALFGNINADDYTAIQGAKYAFTDNIALPLQLLWFSDVHADVSRLAAIAHFQTILSSYFDDVIATGDQVLQYYSDSFDWWAQNGGTNILQVIGNHEVWNGGSDYATAAQAYQKYFAPFISGWNVVSAGTDLCYYYKDYANSNIRLIVLDCMNWDTAQKNWLISTLASAQAANLHVIIAQHYLADEPIPVPCNYTAINVVQEGTMNSEAPQAVQSFIDNGGSFICWIGGHYHADYIYQLKNYPEQYGILVGTASNSQREKNNYRGDERFYNLFNALQIDLTYHQVKIVRIGVTVDRWMRKKHLVSFDYTNGNVIVG